MCAFDCLNYHIISFQNFLFFISKITLGRRSLSQASLIAKCRIRTRSSAYFARSPNNWPIGIDLPAPASGKCNLSSLPWPLHAGSCFCCVAAVTYQWAFQRASLSTHLNIYLGHQLRPASQPARAYQPINE